MTAATVHLRWVDARPPKLSGHDVPGIDHDLYAAALREKPGHWAMLPDVPHSAAVQIRSGTHSAYRPGGSFESAIRHGVVYARYIGRPA